MKASATSVCNNLNKNAWADSWPSSCARCFIQSPPPLWRKGRSLWQHVKEMNFYCSSRNDLLNTTLDCRPPRFASLTSPSCLIDWLPAASWCAAFQHVRWAAGVLRAAAWCDQCFVQSKLCSAPRHISVSATPSHPSGNHEVLGWLSWWLFIAGTTHGSPQSVGSCGGEWRSKVWRVSLSLRVRRKPLWRWNGTKYGRSTKRFD